MQRRQFVCIDSECEHYAKGHLIDGTTLVGDVTRMENCSPTKADAIVGVIRAILNEEMNRTGPFVGLNIFQDPKFPSRVNYARSYGDSFDEFGCIPTAHFLDFESPNEAAAYVAVLQGVLMLGLTRFRVNTERFMHHTGYDRAMELPVIVTEEPPQKVIEQGYTAYDYFTKN